MDRPIVEAAVALIVLAGAFIGLFWLAVWRSMGGGK